MVRMEMSEFDNRVIVEHNDLISSGSNMNKACLKLFEIMVANIDSSSTEIPNNKVFLSKKNVFELLGYSSGNKHTRLKKTFEKLQEAYFEIVFIEQTKSGKKRKRIQRIIPVPFVEWTNYDDVIEMRLSPEILPYLINLKSRFTKYSLQDIVSLDSTHSIMMYRYFKMVSDQNEAYRKGDICIVSLESLKKLTSSENYTSFSNFEARILKSGIDEINKKTSIHVDYERLKSGRKITDIKFVIQKKIMPKQEQKELDLELNDATNSKEIVKKSEEKPLEKNDVYGTEKIINNKDVNYAKNELAEAEFKVIGSPFTKLLSKYEFLSISDLSKVGLIMDLYTKLYPIYSEIVDKYGMDVLENHISYVSQKGANPRYMVNYLLSSAKQHFANCLGEDNNAEEMIYPDEGISGPPIPRYKWIVEK